MYIRVPKLLRARTLPAKYLKNQLTDKARETRTSPRCVFSSRPLTIRADASLSFVTSLQLMIGVLMAFAALMISLIRGTPRVTFIEATPAKWNVFKVICVPGSPIDCAPTAPTVDPKIARASVKYGKKGKKSTGFNLCLDKFRPTGRQKVSQLLLGDSHRIVDPYHGDKQFRKRGAVDQRLHTLVRSTLCTLFQSVLEVTLFPDNRQRCDYVLFNKRTDRPDVGVRTFCAKIW